MKYFALGDVLYSLASLSLLGFVMGGIYNSLSTIMSAIGYLLSVGIKVARADSIHGYRKAHLNQGKHTATESIYDFIFILCYGVIFLLICYLTLDGVVRLYSLIVSVAVFFISKKTLGRMFDKIILYVSHALCKAVFCIVFVLTYPLRVIVSILSKVLSPIVRWLVSLITFIDYSISIHKTRKQMRRFFNSIPKM